MNQSALLRPVNFMLGQVLSDLLVAASQTDLAGVLTGCYLGLGTAGQPWAATKTLADLTQATFTGYARKLVVWGDIGYDSAGRPEVVGGSLQWRPTDAVVQNTITVAFLADAVTNGNLLALAVLAQTVAMENPNNVLTLLPRLAIPGATAPDWGEVIGVT